MVSVVFCWQQKHEGKIHLRENICFYYATFIMMWQNQDDELKTAVNVNFKDEIKMKKKMYKTNVYG